MSGRGDLLAPVDCDVHPIVPGLSALLPYLDDHWRETVVRRGIEDLTTISYPTRNPLSFREDWRDQTGRTATDVSTSRVAGARPVRHPAGDLQLPVWRAGAVQRGPRRRVRPRAERLDRAGMAGPRPSAARLHRRADAERRTGGRRNRALRAATAASSRCCCWSAARCRSAGGNTGRSTPRRNAMACRSASMPAASTAIR